MKLPALAGVVAVAVLLQVVLARYAVGDRWVFDLVLVGVVYVALRSGAAGGLLAGTLGGLLQDLFSGTVLGVGGLAKTLVGGAAGAVGSQFVVTRPLGRTLIVLVASVVHRLLMLGLVAVIDQQWFGVPWMDMLEETVVNGACALALFHASEAVPAAVERGRMSRRTRWGRRTW